MTKKGFTLIELLAVIIILAIVALIATPIILNVIDDARISAGRSEANMILSGINNYCASEEMKYQLDNSYTKICTKDMTKEDVPTMVNLGNATVEKLTYNGTKLTELVVKSNTHTFTLCASGTFVMDDEECNGEIGGEDSQPEEPSDDSGIANSPELLDNMIPVYYDGENWIYADVSQKWYNYDAKEWANAVVLNNDLSKNVGDPISEDEIALWYVWIPRYTYTIFNGNNEGVEEQEIQIKFESGTNSSGTVECVDTANGDSSEICTDSTNGSIKNGTSTYTHPAFTFGDQELRGFWVGKFEVSGSTDEITIKPNITSLRNKAVSSFFTAIQNMSTTYSLNGDSHMMKNMEWGAVVYLSHSKYGTCTDGTCVEVVTNSSSRYYAGGGSSNAYKTNVAQSTTGNIYGVYDMSGGAAEYVMGNMVSSSGSFASAWSGFSETPDSKYYDSYIYDTSYTTQNRGKLGDATKEILKTTGISTGGWYSDYTRFPCSSGTGYWFRRGGGDGKEVNSGLFYFYESNGGSFSDRSTRAILVK